jgi:hypothetical protein
MPLPTITRTAEPPGDWEGFAREHGAFYHLPQWAACLGEIYRLRLQCYSAREAGRLQGLLAVAEVPALLGPRRLVSLPFSYAAGPLALDVRTADALTIALREHARDRGIRRVEVKSRGEYPPAPGFHRTSRYMTFEIPTEQGEAAVWDQLHRGSTQRSIRKAEKSGLVIRRGDTAGDWLIMAEDPAAAITVWKGPRAWIYGFGASDPAQLEHRPNHALIWAAIRDAIGAGCRFDLGRVAPEQEGLLEFKRRWGGQAIPLAYDYWPEPGGLNQAARDRGIMATAATVWTRLPARVARLGAGLYRYLG